MTIKKTEIWGQKIRKVYEEYPFLLFYHYNNVNNVQWRKIKKEITKTKIKSHFLVTKNSLYPYIFFENSNLNEENQSVFDLQINPINNPPLRGEAPLGICKKKKILSKSILNSVFVSIENQRGAPNLSSSDKIKKDQNKLVLKRKADFSKLFRGPTLISGSDSFEGLEVIYNLLKKDPKFVLLGGKVQNQSLNYLDLLKLFNLKNRKNDIKEILDLSRLLSINNLQSIIMNPLLTIIPILKNRK